jgi:hypothetical protein
MAYAASRSHHLFFEVEDATGWTGCVRVNPPSSRRNNWPKVNGPADDDERNKLDIQAVAIAARIVSVLTMPASASKSRRSLGAPWVLTLAIFSVRHYHRMLRITIKAF